MILVNGRKVMFESFPNGELRVPTVQIMRARLALPEAIEQVTLAYQDDSDLIKLLFVKRLLDDWEDAAALTIQYMPYSRMDRAQDGEPFTLKYVTEFINSLNFRYVTVLEPHSDVTPALLNRCRGSELSLELFERVCADQQWTGTTYIFFPDAGAQKRYGKNVPYKQLVGFKHRDFKTGMITDLQVLGEPDETPFRAVIVDDLCSYGNTFIRSAEELTRRGADEIYLVVAHCENSILKGLIPGNDLIRHVFTTDSIFTESHPKITVYELEGTGIRE